MFMVDYINVPLYHMFSL